MNIIAQHEHIFRTGYQVFHNTRWIERQGTTPPDISSATGTVQAYINHGRWIAECPSGCGHAVIATVSTPYFLCTNCGPRTNEGQWFHIVFPDDRQGVETELLKRPETPATPPNMPYMVNTRNWKPSESVNDLRVENVTRGIR